MYTLKIAKSSLIIIVFILSINSCTKQQNNMLNSDDENNIFGDLSSTSDSDWDYNHFRIA